MNIWVCLSHKIYGIPGTMRSPGGVWGRHRGELQPTYLIFPMEEEKSTGVRSLCTPLSFMSCQNTIQKALYFRQKDIKVSEVSKWMNLTDAPTGTNWNPTTNLTCCRVPNDPHQIKNTRKKKENTTKVHV